MTKAQLNYTMNIKCCKYCKHIRYSDSEKFTFCSLMPANSDDVNPEDTCDSFKEIW